MFRAPLLIGWLLPLLLGMLSPAMAGPGTLEVLCAPAMRKPVEEILRAFERESGIRTQVSFDASNILLGQLRLRPHGDLFIPADRFYTDEAVKRRLAEAPLVITAFAPVIVVRKGNPHRVRTLSDLMNRKLRVGLGDERTAAIGKATVELLRRNKIPLAKMNVVYRATKVDELGNAVKVGAVDATILWDAVAWNYQGSVQVIPIPARQNRVVPVSAAILSASRQKDAARRLLRFLASEKAKAILRKHHYPAPPFGEANRE